MNYDMNTTAALQFGVWIISVKYFAELIFFVLAPFLLMFIYLKLLKISAQLKNIKEITTVIGTKIKTDNEIN